MTLRSPAAPYRCRPRSWARGVRQRDARYSRERQLSGRHRLLGAVRVDAPGSGRAARPTFANGHAWFSGRRRQGNPRLPDRPWRHGGRAIHFQRKVNPRDYSQGRPRGQMQGWLRKVHFLLAVSLSYDLLRKCTTKEITAMINRRWMSPPATWKAKNPSSQNTRKITNSARNIEISFVRSGLPPVTARRAFGG